MPRAEQPQELEVSPAGRPWWLLALAVFLVATLAAALGTSAYNGSFGSGSLWSAAGIGACVAVGWAVASRRRARR